MTALKLLLLTISSRVWLVLVATFSMDPVVVGLTLTTIVAVATAPPARSPKLHVTTPEDSLHDPGLADIDTSVVPAGKASSILTLVEVAELLLVTCMV